MKSIYLKLLLLIFSSSLYGQSISGTVSDANGVPLMGVSVLVKGTSKGTTTDFDGKYIIEAGKGAILKFSYLGMTSQEIAVGDQSTVNVTLQEDATNLDEVVVTAFGIKRSTKELGYSVTKVNTAELNMAGRADAMTALQGQVAGLQISNTSGSAGGGVDILIRSVTSVNPDRNNQPLFIIDGLALNNDTFSGSVLPSDGSNSPSSSEQFSFSNRAADINPDDIESINVLKGAAATALYGVRAANGAVVITTKKGKEGKAKINISASTSFRNVNKTPTLQEVYREGWNGRVEILYTPETDSGFTEVFDSTPFHTWGPKYSADSVTNPDGQVIDLSNDRFYDPYDLFRTGVNKMVNFNISGASEKLDYYFSIGDNKEEGIMPNTEYRKTNLRFKAGYQIKDNLSLNTSITYTNSGGKRSNGGDKSVMSALAYFSPTFPVNDYVNADGSQRNFTPWIDNPRYFLEKSFLKDDVNRWLGNVTLNWQPKDWLNVTYAAQVDNYSDQRNRFVPPELDTGVKVNGFIVEQDINFLGLESNFLVSAEKEFSEDFSATLTIGNQISDSRRDYNMVRGETLNVPGINQISNTINLFTKSEVEQERNVGVFGELKMAYKNSLFLTVTGRNDWVSVLPKDNRSFFYPSVSLAYDLKDLIGENDIVNFAKLRTSWAEVGKGPTFGKIGHFFEPDGDFPFGGAGGYRSRTQLGDVNMVPEKNQSFEIGADLRLFQNRVRVDYAYYKTRVKEQIFTVNTAPSSGFSGFTRNAGDFESFGHELLIDASIIRKADLKWNIGINWSTNEGEVLALPEDVESVVFVSSGFAGVTSEVKEGDKMGSLYGYTWQYENGERYIGSDGLPRVDLSERKVVGNAFPDFVASINNRLSYKGFDFNFLLEWKEGGDLYDSGRRNMIRNGTLGVTEFRNETTVLAGVMDDGSGGFVPNTQEVLIDQNYYRSSTRYNRASEVLVQDASWVKLRNIGLTYNFSGKLLERLKVDKMAFTVSAQNLLIWTPFDGFDPEGNQYSAGSNVYGFTGLNTPLSESYSLGINIGF
ncbi:MAG: SusC/RagA family TonB-linked outer membrane protein [Flavobacteriaceae bacterium]|nr:SusC/RagA family TonB-linked outer membrane protein [Flavobacteriaceae bacterium]